MLAVVKEPHTEISISGIGAEKILEFLKQRFTVNIVSQDIDDDDEEYVNINETDWWHENKHRVLAGARHKIEITQKELAYMSGVPQPVISAIENGKRKLTMKTAVKLAKVLKTEPQCLITD